MEEKKLIHVSTECPVCGEETNGLAEASNSEMAPQVGDVVVCANCSTVMKYEIDKARVITDEELKDLKANYPEVWKTVEMLIQTVQKNP